MLLTELLVESEKKPEMNVDADVVCIFYFVLLL